MRSIWKFQRATVYEIARDLAREDEPDLPFKLQQSYQRTVLAAIAAGAFPEGAVTFQADAALGGPRLKHKEPPIGIPLSHAEARKVVLEKGEAAFSLLIEIPAARQWRNSTKENARNTTNKSRPELPIRGHVLRSSLQEWYRDEWVKDGKAHDWLRMQGRPQGATPTADDDLKAAKEKFGTAVSRDMTRPLRRDFAPDAWTRRGKKAKA